jgi:DNA-binding transcriptional ArsR family regulator
MEHRHHSWMNGPLGQALGHPIRIAFLRLLARRTSLSPVEALSEMPSALKELPEAQQVLVGNELALSQISYHVGVLENLGIVETEGQPDRQGRSLFRVSEAGELVMFVIDAPFEGGST